MMTIAVYRLGALIDLCSFDEAAASFDLSPDDRATLEMGAEIALDPFTTLQKNDDGTGL